jgi:carotenoid cleavage dioxygenase-like enzyme
VESDRRLKPHHAVVRRSVARPHPRSYGIEQMYPHQGALPRQDDRYNTMPYRYGFLPCPRPVSTCYARFDHQNRTSTLYNAGSATTLDECCFAPRSKTAPEGAGYLMASRIVPTRMAAPTS